MQLAHIADVIHKVALKLRKADWIGGDKTKIALLTDRMVGALNSNSRSMFTQLYAEMAAEEPDLFDLLFEEVFEEMDCRTFHDFNKLLQEAT